MVNDLGQGVIVDLDVDVKDLSFLISSCIPATLPSLLSVLQHIPGWNQEAAAAAECSKISGAMTNLVFKLTSSLATENPWVILRVFGQGGRLFSRHQEAGVFFVASHLRIGPQCLVRFNNGRIEQFIPGTPLPAAAMRDRDTSAAIAAALVEFHVRMYKVLPAISALSEDESQRERQHSRNGDPNPLQEPLQGSSPRIVDAPNSSTLWRRLRKWLTTAMEVAPEVVEELQLEAVDGEIDALRLELAEVWGPPWIGFCHNDLQHGNILSTQEALDESERNQGLGQEGAGTDGSTAGSQQRLTIIDYEYASVGDVAFDIANHWCEWAADYQSAEGSNIDFLKMPQLHEQQHFCLSYIRHLFTAYPGSSLAIEAQTQLMMLRGAEQLERLKLDLQVSEGDNMPLTETQTGPNFTKGDTVLVAEILRRRALCCIPLSHLKWGLWGLMQWKLSNVEFDYLGYAKLRLREYHATKKEFIRGRHDVINQNNKQDGIVW